MSQIEVGTLQMFKWWDFRGYPDQLLNPDGTQRVSPLSQRPMKKLVMLPEHVSNNVEMWRVLHWQRKASERHLALRYQDVVDRMKWNGDGDTLEDANSRLRKRLSRGVQDWSQKMGILPHAFAVKNGFPSKRAFHTIEHLTWQQAKLNTWWNVEWIPELSVWMIRQPAVHDGYQDTNLLTNTPSTTGRTPIFKEFEIGVSVKVRFIDDAMLFLHIKADEAQIEGGRDRLLDMLWAGDIEDWLPGRWRDELRLEFERWRRLRPRGETF